MATSLLTYITGTLRTVLDTDATLTPVPVFTESGVTDIVNVHVGVQTVAYPESYESMRSGTRGVASCYVLASTKADGDPDKTGTNTEKAGLVAKAVHAALATYDVESVTPNSDGIFTSHIIGWTLDSHDGHFDNADGKIQMGFAITVHFIITPN